MNPNLKGRLLLKVSHFSVGHDTLHCDDTLSNDRAALT